MWCSRHRSDDLAALERVIHERHALLVIIDVLNAYLGTAKRPIDSYRDSDIRSVLSPLAKMAERQRVALLATMHLTKNTERRALYRVLGSIGYLAQARMVLAASFDPGDPEQQRRLLAGMKGNIARRAPTLAFAITDAGLQWEPNQVQGMSAEQALGNPPSPDEHDARHAAREFLQARLHPGTEVEVNVLVEEAKQQGIALRTLQRARKDLGARPRHDGPSGKWYWGLPIRRFVGRDKQEALEGDGLGEMPPDDASVASWQVASISTEENADTPELSGQPANLPTSQPGGQGATLDPALRRQYEDAAARLRRRMRGSETQKGSQRHG
jgi:AAA domain